MLCAFANRLVCQSDFYTVENKAHFILVHLKPVYLFTKILSQPRSKREVNEDLLRINMRVACP